MDPRPAGRPARSLAARTHPAVRLHTAAVVGSAVCCPGRRHDPPEVPDPVPPDHRHHDRDRGRRTASYQADDGPPFKTPQVPALPIISALACVGLMANLALETWLRFLVWLVVGMVIYLAYGRSHSLLAPGRKDEVAAELGGDSIA